MDLNTKEWELVRFLNTNGWDGEAEEANRYLKEGAVYTVDCIIVDKWSSEVFLKEYPMIGFNTVMFENVDDGYYDF